MKPKIPLCLLFVLLIQGQQIVLASPQNDAAKPQTGRAERIRSLSRELRWQGETAHEHYNSVREEVTSSLLSEIDGYIWENFNAGSASPHQIKSGLDRLLGYKAGDEANNLAYSAQLPQGNFLILGLEVQRGGGAVSDDLVSFRAYSNSEGKFRLVASTEDLSGSPLMELHAFPIPSQTPNTEFSFLALNGRAELRHFRPGTSPTLFPY